METTKREINEDTKKWLDDESDRIQKEKIENSKWVKIQDGQTVNITILAGSENNFPRTNNNFGNEVVDVPCVLNGTDKIWSLKPTGDDYALIVDLLKKGVMSFNVTRNGLGTDTRYKIEEG